MKSTCTQERVRVGVGHGVLDLGHALAGWRAAAPARLPSHLSPALSPRCRASAVYQHLRAPILVFSAKPTRGSRPRRLARERPHSCCSPHGEAGGCPGAGSCSSGACPGSELAAALDADTAAVSRLQLAPPPCHRGCLGWLEMSIPSDLQHAMCSDPDSRWYTVIRAGPRVAAAATHLACRRLSAAYCAAAHRRARPARSARAPRLA